MRKKEGIMILGLHSSAILETLIYLSLLLAGNHLFGSGDNFIHTSLHPFWVIILLVTVQYGTIDGIASVVLSTLFLYLGNIPPQKIAENFFEYQARLAFLPAIWFATAYILGEMRMKLQVQLNELILREKNLTKQLKEITEGFQKLKLKKEKIETRLAQQTKSLAKTYEILMDLETLDPIELLLSVDEVIHQILQVEKFSLYGLGEQGFEPITCYGWTEDDNFQIKYDKSTPLYKAITEKKRMLSIINEEDEKILSNEGIVVSPLLDPETNKMIGFIKIEKIDYFDLNLSTLETFKKLCELISLSYLNARRHKVMKKQLMYSQNTISFSKYLSKVLEPILKSIFEHNHIECSKVSINCCGKNAEAASKMIKNHLKTPHLLFEGANVESNLNVIIPGTGKNEAAQLILKALDELKILESLPELRYEIKTSSLIKKEEEKSDKTYVK